MNNDKFHEGKWWLPEKPEHKVSGTLSLSPEMVLETIGELDDMSFLENSSSNSQNKLSVIWGIDSNANSISIFGYPVGMTQNTSCPFALIKYKIQVVTIGAYIKSWDDVDNYDVEVAIPELSYWYRPKCIMSGSKGNDIYWTSHIDKNNTLTIKIDEGCTLNLEPKINISQEDFGLNLCINQETRLTFCFDDKISMQDAKRYVFSFEQFLSFATLSPIQNSHFWLIEKGKSNDSCQSNSIEVIERRYPRKINSIFWEYLFVHETIANSFDKIITKWYSEKQLSPIRAHLIDSISHKGYFETNDFLIICQAIEGFYYRFRQDDNFTNIFKNLIMEFSDIQIQEICEDDIKYIQDTRNHFSHLLPPGKKNHVLQGHELYMLNHKLRKLLFCCILNLIGFSNHDINNIFSHSHNHFLSMVNGKERSIVEVEATKFEGKITEVTKIVDLKE